METEIPNPVIKDESTELRDQLRGMAEEAGPLTGNEFDSETSSAENTEARASVDTEKEIKYEEDKPDNSEAGPGKIKERPRDEQGRFTKTEQGVDIPEAERRPAEESRPQSRYAKANQTREEKDRDRQDRSWRALEAEKERVRAEGQRLAQERTQFQQQQAPKRPVDTEGRPISSRGLLDAHDDFRAKAKKALEEGDLDTFGEKTALAEQAFDTASRVFILEQEEQQQVAHKQHEQAWVGHMNAAIQKEPDLAKPDSPLSKAVQSLLQSHGSVAWMIPDGFNHIVAFAKKEIEAGSASGLREENQKLKAENARLNGNLSLNGSGPSGGPAPTKRFEDMSLDEMKQQLRGVAESAGSLATA